MKWFKEYAIKHGLLRKEDIEDNGTGNKKKDRFLTGNVRKLNPFVNYISDEEIRKRLENDDIYH
jgi:hypothetical protein